MLSLSDAKRAEAVLPTDLRVYRGVGAEAAALRRNRQALDDWAFVPCLLADVSQICPSIFFSGSPV